MAETKELVAALRKMSEQSKALGQLTGWGNYGLSDLFSDAADAIEELLAHVHVSENEYRVCENCSLQHFDSDGMRWCEELSMVVGGNFYCGFFEGSEPPKEVE